MYVRIVDRKDGTPLGDYQDIKTIYVCSEHITMFSGSTGNEATEFLLKDVRVIMHDNDKEL